MDWTQTLTIIGTFVGGFLFLLAKIEKISERLIRLEEQLKNTNQRIDDFKHEVSQRISTIEGYLVPKKIFHFEESPKEEQKEN